MRPKVVIFVFPGSNSEEETQRALEAVGISVRLVRSDDVTEVTRDADGYVLPGGFAYEDRIRAGAVAAHDRVFDVVVEAAERGKPILGICNGAQMLAEAGLVPGTGAIRRPTAAFAPNANGGRFRCVHTHVRLAVPSARSPLLASFADDTVIPAWAAHGEGRLAASHEELARMQAGAHIAMVYCNAHGEVTAEAIPNGSALGAAALVNVAGNVLAIMPHPERDAWSFMQRTGRPRPFDVGDAMTPSGGIVLFEGFARAFELI